VKRILKSLGFGGMDDQLAKLMSIDVMQNSCLKLLL